MSAAHLHLALNHAPLFAIIFATLGLGWALARGRDGVARHSLSLLVLAGVLSVPVYLTGEQAEEVVEHRTGVFEAVIEAHEEAALGAALATGLVALVALAALVVYRRRGYPRRVVAVILLLSLGVGGWNGYVANLGGQISHPELRAEAPALERGEYGSGEHEGRYDDD